MAGLHSLRAFAAAGVFDKAAGIITGKLDDESRAVLPVGVLCEIDCDTACLSILEPGVKE